MEKEVKIVPPEGYEVDKENSTFDCIKFKLIGRWRDSNPDVKGWTINNHYITREFTNLIWKDNLDVFATEKLAKSAFAIARISQIMTNDERFGGVVTDEEWNDNILYKYTITRCNNYVSCGISFSAYHFLAFRSSDQRDLFLKENEDLVKDFLMID